MYITHTRIFRINKIIKFLYIYACYIIYTYTVEPTQTSTAIKHARNYLPRVLYHIIVRTYSDASGENYNTHSSDDYTE